jgi:tetratricopeptide (TPR) repeat protein
MKTGIIALLLFLLLIPTINAGYAASSQQELAALFMLGNAEYQQGKYESAERNYLQILNSGADSGVLYYNLGNTCFKQKKLGYAIFYWEKARQKLPADPELRENLELANLMIVDRIETRTDPLPVRILLWIPGLLTIPQASWLTLALFVVANLLFSAFLLAKNSRTSSRALIASIAAGFLFLASACSLCWEVYERDFKKNGIVTEQKVDLRSGPGMENVTVFTLHEGIKVRVHESANGWYQISLPNGWSGWLLQDNLRVL